MKSLLRSLVLVLIRLIGLPRANAVQRKLSQKAQQPVMQPRILLVRPDHLGDMVLTTPVLAALKSHMPDAHITMMVGAWSSEVVARNTDVDRIITCTFPGFRRTAQGMFEPYIQMFQVAQQLRRQRYDLAINLRPDFWWGAALLYLAAIPRCVGYAIHPGTPFLTTSLPFNAPEQAPLSSLRLVSAGIQALGRGTLDEPYTPEAYPLVFEPTSEEQAWVSEYVRNADISGDAPLVAIHPGTGAPVKLWRNEAWTHVADALHASRNAHIVLTGSTTERPMLEEIAKQMTVTPLLITGTTVGQLAAVLQRADIVLGVDSGPLHLAVAQGTPTIQIFGPTDARIFGPWGPAEQHSVIASTQRCPTCLVIPCGRLDFRPEELAEHPCVRLVSEQAVLDAANHVLNKHSKAEDKHL